MDLCKFSRKSHNVLEREQNRLFENKTSPTVEIKCHRFETTKHIRREC